GLDFGCGPGPALAAMFSEVGYKMHRYDPFYADNCHVLKSGFYDFVTATEVIEHVRNPKKVFNQLLGFLKPGGFLGIMTKLVKDEESFSRWHYKNDRTHIRFFSRETFNFIAKRHNCSIEFIGNDVVILKKNNRRQLCKSCHLPIKSCICSSIKEINNRLPIIIIRHENEVKHPLNTVRIIKASLTNCIVVDGSHNFLDELTPIIANKQPFLLYPDENAIMAEGFSDECDNLIFIVLDGTWRETRAILANNPWLESIKRISFSKMPASNYILRKGPENGVSTLEAVVYLLSSIEKASENYHPLLTAFEAMINKQINCIDSETFKKNYCK
ncbi:MAG: DTW domain-containing protein, partial [Lentisphaeria bacterium]